MSMKIKHGASYTKHLDTTPVSFSFNNYDGLFGPLVGSNLYGMPPAYQPTLGMGSTLGYPGYPFGQSLKKGDIIDGITFYDPLNPLKNTQSVPLNSTIPMMNGLDLTSNLTSNCVKTFSNSEISVNIVGTDNDCTKAVKILEKMYKDHAAEIAQL
jgi:hypothetical protein